MKRYIYVILGIVILILSVAYLDNWYLLILPMFVAGFLIGWNLNKKNV